MRNSIYLCLLVVLLVAIAVVLPMTVVGKAITIGLAILTLVLAGMDEYIERNKGQLPNHRLFIRGVALAGFVFSILESIASLFWAYMSLSVARTNSGDEAEASLMAVVLLPSLVWTILYGSIFTYCRKQAQKPNVVDHK